MALKDISWRTGQIPDVTPLKNKFTCFEAKKKINLYL